MGAKSKILSLFKENVDKPLGKDLLATTAAVHDWARVIRSLRQEGYAIELLQSGDYVLHSLEISSTGNKRLTIDAKTRYRILQRDESTCQRCGRSVKDGVKLHIDHKIPVEMGGTTDDDNLWALCEGCNLGKKHWFSDENNEAMKEVFSQKSGMARLEKYFKINPGVLLEPIKLGLVSGIRDWERTLRFLRGKKGMKIAYKKGGGPEGQDGYIYTE